MADRSPDHGVTPGLDRLEAQFRKASPVFRETVAHLRNELGPEWAHRLDGTLTRLFPTAAELDAAVEGYSRFALQTVRLQIRFEKEREYVPKSYADAMAEVYANDQYMLSCYLPGLLLSQYLWPHHYRQWRFFERTFVEAMAQAGAELFYDVGVGTGFYSRLALSGAAGARGIGFDVSPSSKYFAESHVRSFDAADRYAIELRDVIERPAAPVDWLICVEVLEHLEQPLALLRSLRAMLRTGGKAFITAALNAPHADHIYLYRTSQEVKTQLLEAGFAIEQYFGALAGRPRKPDAPVAEVVAFTVT
jgi:SAM-dependent methyltransferase